MAFGGARRWKREIEKERELEDTEPAMVAGGGLDGAGRWKRERTQRGSAGGGGRQRRSQW